MKVFDSTASTEWLVDTDGSTYSRNIKTGLLLKKKPYNHAHGYQYIRTANRNFQLHRIVAEAYVPKVEGKLCVNHKDCNKHNNSVTNLEWVTHAENNKHARDMGRVTLMKKNEGANLKYTNEQCSGVLRLIKNGLTYKKAGGIYDMPYSTVAHLARGSRREITV